MDTLQLIMQNEPHKIRNHKVFKIAVSPQVFGLVYTDAFRNFLLPLIWHKVLEKNWKILNMKKFSQMEMLWIQSNIDRLSYGEKASENPSV